jgi:hypothetical protein
VHVAQRGPKRDCKSATAVGRPATTSRWHGQARAGAACGIGARGAAWAAAQLAMLPYPHRCFRLYTSSAIGVRLLSRWAGRALQPASFGLNRRAALPAGRDGRSLGAGAHAKPGPAHTQAARCQLVAARVKGGRDWRVGRLRREWRNCKASTDMQAWVSLPNGLSHTNLKGHWEAHPFLLLHARHSLPPTQVWQPGPAGAHGFVAA